MSDERWRCGACGKWTTARHWKTNADGTMRHDPEGVDVVILALSGRDVVAISAEGATVVGMIVDFTPNHLQRLFGEAERATITIDEREHDR